MKKYIFGIISLLMISSLSACDLFGEDANNQSFDNENITEVEGQDEYYVDSKLSMCAEIRGSYKANRPFTLDSNNENIRIWDNYYLYEYDYFQMIQDESKYIFYEVDASSKQYVDIESSKAIIKQGKSGIYKLTFDLVNKVFGLEFKNEIITPVYEEMEGCDVYTLSHDGFSQMTTNPNNSEELMISDYEIALGEIVSFYNHGNYHLSNYKVVPDFMLLGKLINGLNDGDAHPAIMIGGKYNLYINPKTYAFRAELLNPNEAIYSLMTIENGEYVKRNHDNNDPAYLFHYRIDVTKQYQSMPLLFNNEYQMFELDITEGEYVNKYGQFKMPGLYSLDIDLKEFIITVTYLPQ